MNTPIFIHSLFRTGSTYIWSKFRANSDYKCYYEPFHNELLGITKEGLVTVDKDALEFNKHPYQDKHYFYEYSDFIDDVGVNNFKERFVVQEFCYNGDNISLKKYIDMLLHGDKVPVLQFNRSSLRTKWFVNNYPESTNIYLYRNARDNFMSYERYLSLDNPFFSAMSLLVIISQLRQPVFKWLSDYIKFPSITGSIEDDIDICGNEVADMSVVDRYLIFYTIWYTSLVFNARYADFCLDINKLTNSFSYNNSFVEYLVSIGVHSITFNDAAMTTFDDYVLDDNVFSFIELLVHNKINKLISSAVENV